MNNVVDEVLTGNPKYRIYDNGGNVLYDNLTIEQITPVSVQGTPLNKVLFDSIKDDINSRLLISNKATQAEAEAGSNDVKYMTPLKTKKYCDKNVGCKMTKIALVTGTTTSLDITEYFTSQTEKVEIVLDVACSTTNNGGKLTLNATNIRVNYGGTTGSFSTSRNINGTTTASTIIGKLELYPRMELTTATNSGVYIYTGIVGNSVSEVGTFSGLSTIILPRLLNNSNYTYQVAIYQYLR